MRNFILFLFFSVLGTVAFADDRKDAEESIKKANESLEKKDWQKALARFEIALKLAPELKSPYYGIGLAYQGLGDCVKATEAFRVYLDKSPTGQRVNEAKEGIAKCNDSLPASQPTSETLISPETKEVKISLEGDKGKEVPSTLPVEQPPILVQPEVPPQSNRIDNQAEVPSLTPEKSPVALYGTGIGGALLGIGGVAAFAVLQADINDEGDAPSIAHFRGAFVGVGGGLLVSSVACFVIAKKRQQSSPKSTETQASLSPMSAISSK